MREAECHSTRELSFSCGTTSVTLLGVPPSKHQNSDATWTATVQVRNTTSITDGQLPLLQPWQPMQIIFAPLPGNRRPRIHLRMNPNPKQNQTHFILNIILRGGNQAENLPCHRRLLELCQKRLGADLSDDFKRHHT